MSFIMVAHSIVWLTEREETVLTDNGRIRIMKQDKLHRGVEVYKEAHCSDTITDNTV